MQNLIETIKLKAQEIVKETVANRRHLHAHPELSFHEYETAAFVAQKLQALGIPVQTGVANTGVVGIIEGKNPSKKIIALRADMDALPIFEQNTIDYKSQNEGIMHACGHDAHTASLLGTAQILQSLKDNFEGTVKLIFQPAEEKNPGGASLMIKDGVLENPAPVSIFGQHVAYQLPVGKIGFREGMYMASADEIYITVRGKGGHGAMPENCIDSVLVASHIIVALQQIVSRNANPKTPSVLTFGKMIANGATNIIPNEVYMEGTFRTLDEKWRETALQKIKKLAETLAESMGATCTCEISKGYPYLYNSPQTTQRARQAATQYVGNENIVPLELAMGAEDFAFYSHQIDACFYRLGTRNEAKGIVSGIHTPTFDIDEESLGISTGLMAWLAINELESK